MTKTQIPTWVKRFNVQGSEVQAHLAFRPLRAESHKAYRLFSFAVFVVCCQSSFGYFSALQRFLRVVSCPLVFSLSFLSLHCFDLWPLAFNL